MAKGDKAATEPEASGKPRLGVLVHDVGDGNLAVHAIEPNGVEHQIVIPGNSGIAIAFEQLLLDWFNRVGMRATTWDRQTAVEAAPAKKTPAPEPEDSYDAA